MTESDHRKAYQEYLKEKTFRTVVIHFDIKKGFYQICGRYTGCIKKTQARNFLRNHFLSIKDFRHLGIEIELLIDHITVVVHLINA